MANGEKWSLASLVHKLDNLFAYAPGFEFALPVYEHADDSENAESAQRFT